MMTRRDADLPEVGLPPLDGAGRLPARRRTGQSPTDAGQKGGKARAAAHRTLMQQLPWLVLASANYITTSVGQLPAGTPAEHVTALAEHVPPLLVSLRRHRVPYAPCRDPRALVPFLLAGYSYARILDDLAGPGPVTWESSDLAADDDWTFRHRWGPFAETLFAGRRARRAWLANCCWAARGIRWFNGYNAKALLALARRCANPACPEPFYSFRGPRASRTCGAPRCQQAMWRAARRRRRRRAVKIQHVKQKDSGPRGAPSRRGSPLVSRPAAR